MEATLTLKKYEVELEQFVYTAHQDPEGKQFLKPRHDTKAVQATKLVVDAIDEIHAEAEFKKALGIIGTEKKFTVHCLTPDDGRVAAAAATAEAVEAEIAEAKEDLKAAKAKIKALAKEKEAAAEQAKRLEETEAALAKIRAERDELAKAANSGPSAEELAEFEQFKAAKAELEANKKKTKAAKPKK